MTPINQKETIERNAGEFLGESSRMYFINSMYLIGIHAGIQAGHAAVRAMLKYHTNKFNDEEVTPDHFLSDWARCNETFVVLNGGYQTSLQDFLTMFEGDNNPYPFSPFYESKEALNGALTSIAIVLPDYVYDVMSLIRQRVYDKCPHEIEKENEEGVVEIIKFDEFHRSLINKLYSLPLMS